ncbi:MAG TPA: helix-turn-helix transcriptional regulator [Puia sp.]
MTAVKHIGRNIRNIRLLRGMKQETFAQLMGLLQQEVSRMEKQQSIRSDRLEAAAKILTVTVETIERFDEEAILNGSFQQEIPQPSQTVKEVIAYFKDELISKDQEIHELRNELSLLRSWEITK